MSAARAAIGRGGRKILSVVEWADHVVAAAISPVRSSPSASISDFLFPPDDSSERIGRKNLDYDLMILLAATLQHAFVEVYFDFSCLVAVTLCGLLGSARIVRVLASSTIFLDHPHKTRIPVQSRTIH